MHNFVRTISILSMTACFSFSAHAIENEYKPYIGIDYAYTTATAKYIRPHNNSAIIILGSTYNPYFSTEMFFQYSDKDKLSNSNIAKTSFYSYGLDTIAYLPLGCNGTIAPLATLGIGEYTVKNKLITSSNKKDHGYGYRFGGGLRYNIDNNWSIQSIARYIKTNKIRNYDHLTEYTLGLRYIF